MTNAWVRDTGLLFALLALLCAYYGYSWGVPGAAALILIAMFAPQALRPLAFFWMKLAHGLGLVTHRVLLGATFFLIVTPVGYVRRMFVREAQVPFGSAHITSAFHEREQRAVSRGDLEKPF
jgi:hypothetical protein